MSNSLCVLRFARLRFVRFALCAFAFARLRFVRLPERVEFRFWPL